MNSAVSSSSLWITHVSSENSLILACKKKMEAKMCTAKKEATMMTMIRDSVEVNYRLLIVLKIRGMYLVILSSFTTRMMLIKSAMFCRCIFS